MAGSKKNKQKSQSSQKKPNKEVKKSEHKHVKETNDSASRDDQMNDTDQVIEDRQVAPSPLSTRQKKNKKRFDSASCDDQMNDTDPVIEVAQVAPSPLSTRQKKNKKRFASIKSEPDEKLANTTQISDDFDDVNTSSQSNYKHRSDTNELQNANYFENSGNKQGLEESDLRKTAGTESPHPKKNVSYAQCSSNYKSKGDEESANPYSPQRQDRFGNAISNNRERSELSQKRIDWRNQQGVAGHPHKLSRSYNGDHYSDSKNKNLHQTGKFSVSSTSHSECLPTQGRNSSWGSGSMNDCKRNSKQIDWDECSRGSDPHSKDKEFDEFENALRRNQFKGYKFVKVNEIDQDLFAMGEEHCLAHCVAEDMNMGSGIAVQFSQLFKRRDELYNQKQRQGGLAVLQDKERYIYYLVTKKYSNGKPTMRTMWSSLRKLKDHIETHQVRKLAIPRIGCGLDRLDWSEVKVMIDHIFINTDVVITVCNFQQPEEENSMGDKRPTPTKQYKCLVKNVTYPLVDIEPGTAIIYFGTENGFVSEEIERLNTKFAIISDYKRQSKKLGEIIHAFKNNENYSLFGCIVRKTEKDPFDFVNFQKCINQLKKINKTNYCYVAIQAFLDDDDLILNKITNMLRFSLITKIEVYVCWGGNMLKFMPQERQEYY